MKFHTRKRVVAIVALLALLDLPGAGAADPKPAPASPAPLDTLFNDDVLAQGKGIKVTSSQLEQAFVSFKANLAARGERIAENERTVREAQLLDRLIVTQILTNRATAADRVVAVGLAEKFTVDARKGSSSEEAFNRQLKAMSVSPEQFQRRVQDQALAEAVIERELKSTLTVTDADVQDFYKTGTDLLVKTMQADLDSMAGKPSAKPADLAALRERIDGVRKLNLSRLDQPEKVRIAHIFLATRDRQSEDELNAEQKKLKRQQLEKLRTRALAGEDFMDLVQKFSEDHSLAQTKGEYTLARNDSFSPEFKSAAFSLEPGKISDVVTTPFGFHILKVLEKNPAQKADFEKVSKELKDFLLQQSLQKAMPDYFAKLKKEAAVQVLEPKYRLEAKDLDPAVQP
ncbi:MAG: peptidyl-prolyl cis-trans isomerase [Verrucomicrobiota bacterium]|jgi:peptidyl-prolyl cis-trans isomerase C